MEKDDGEQRRQKICVSRSSRGTEEVLRESKERERESESVQGEHPQDREKRTNMKFLNVEKRLSAPIFSV